MDQPDYIAAYICSIDDQIPPYLGCQYIIVVLRRVWRHHNLVLYILIVNAVSSPASSCTFFAHPSRGGFFLSHSRMSFLFSFFPQLVANFLVFVSVNLVGLFVHNLMEHAQRKAFLDTRNCIAARLEMEDENEKLVSA